MEIIKPTLDQIKYLSDVPTSGTGQQQIDWMKDGERPKGANPAVVGDKSGVLNRPSVQIADNVEVLDENQDTLLNKVNEIIDQVNVHDDIINAGDGKDLYTRVDDLEKNAINHTEDILDIRENDIFIEAKVESISDVIGTPDPSLKFRTLREDDSHIKNMVGNYSDFDVDGNPSPGSYSSGVKGQVERNYNTTIKQDVRITSLEKWWEDSTPASLKEDVNQIRSELGDYTNGSAPVYDRLSALELIDETNTPTIQELVEHTGLYKYPVQYKDVESEVYVQVDDISDYVIRNKKDIDYISSISKEAHGKVEDVDRSLGKPNDSVLSSSAWGNINKLKTTVSNHDSILGVSPLDGLQGRVGTIDKREQEHFDSLDSRVVGLSETVNVDFRTSISDLQNIVSNPTTGLFVRMEGTKNQSDPEFLRRGTYSSSKEMFDTMFKEYKLGSGYIVNPPNQQPNAVWSREYDGDKWIWRNIFDTDFTLGYEKNIETTSGVSLISYSTDSDGKHIPTFGNDGSTNIKIVGNIIGNLYLDSTSDIIKYGKPLIASTDRTVSIGQNDKSLVIKGKDITSIKYATQTDEYDILHVGNYKNYISDINPENGFVLNSSSKISYAGTDVIRLDTDTIRFGSPDVKISIDGNVDKLVLSNTGSIKLNTDINTESFAIQTTNGNIIFGDSGTKNILATDFYVQSVGSELNKVWHQGMDAPSDGEFYARKNNKWMVVESGSGSGNISDAPMSGKSYARVNDDGVGFWEEVGSRDINLARGISIKSETNGGNTTILSVNPLTTETKLGIGSGTLKLEGTVDDILLKSKISTAAGVLIEKQTGYISIGDVTSKVPVYSSGDLFVGKFGEASRVWTDAHDAPSDGEFYARKENKWSLIHDGIDPSKNVAVNEDRAYNIGTYRVAKVDSVGTDKLMKLGDAKTFLELSGKVTSIKLADGGSNTSFGITTSVNGTDVNVVSVSQPTTEKHIKVGDSTLPLRIESSVATINGDEILTESSFEAPKDGNKYVRQDGVWTRAYYYGDFATDAPSTPKEGDVFFEFIN